MAYLTEFSFRQLVETTEIKNLDKIDLQFFTANIFDNQYLFYFFNQFDLKKLFREKILLSGNKKFIVVYKEVPERNDNLNYVLEIKGKVKYHLINDCNALTKGFKNFFMPETVVRLKEKNPEKHLEIVNDIRDWFKINDYTADRYEKGYINDKVLTVAFNNTFPNKYEEIAPIFISQSDKEENQFKWYISKKTGIVEVESIFDYNFFLSNIIELIKQRDYLCNSSTMRNLSKYDFLLNKDESYILNLINENIQKGILNNVSESFIKNYGLNNLQVFWEKHKNLKIKAYNELSNYFKWTYNLKEKVFDEVELNSYNLESCILCKNRVEINSL